MRLAPGALALLLVLGGCKQSPAVLRAKHLAKGEELAQKQDYSRAILEYRNALRAAPADAEIYYQLGEALLASGEVPEAVAALRQALEINPKHVQAELRMDQLRSSTGDAKLMREAEDHLNELVQSTAVTQEMLTTLALTELRLGKTDDAVGALERALAQSPGELSSSVLLAKTNLTQGRVASAEEILKKARDSAPGSPDGYRFLGGFYVSQNRPADAEAQFRRALEIDPKHGPALLDLGRLQYAQGRTQEAERTFMKLAGIGQEAFEPVYGLFLFQAGRPEEAVREFQRLAKKNPSDRLTRSRLVMAYQACGQTNEAQKLLDEALVKNSKDVDALLQRAGLLIRAGRPDRAEVDVNQVVRLRPNSAEVRYVIAKLYQARGLQHRYRQELTETVQLNPYLLSARAELVQVLLSMNQARTARAVLNEAPQSQQQTLAILVQRNWVAWAQGYLAEMRKGIDKGLAQERSLDLLIQDGLWKLKMGNPSAGQAALQEALKIDAGDLRALTALTNSDFEQKGRAAALERVRDYAARQPKSAGVQEFLGTLLMANGDRAQARTALVAANALEPQSLSAELSLVQLDALEGKWGDARNRLQTILAAQESPIARLWLGNVEEIGRNHTAAIEHYRKVVETDSGNVQALNNLAYLLADYANKADEALKYAEKAAELAPDDADVADTLGWVMYRKGFYSTAVKRLEAATRNNRPIPMFHLAMAYAKAGDAGKGRATLQAALKVGPGLPEARLAEALLMQAR
jgi:tetratricopeptide (TPR) repeat protein